MADGSAIRADVNADAFTRAHDALLRQTDLQFQFAVFRPPVVPTWLKALGDLLKSIAPASPYVFWGCLILGGLAVLVFLFRELIGLRLPRFRRRSKPAPAPEWRPSEARARTLLEDADKLAALGRFGEAAHLILFRSIEDIDGRWPNLVRPALTSRDIAGHQGLPERARQTFGEIARVVERGVFGGRALGAEDFAFCRTAYETFALPGGGA